MTHCYEYKKKLNRFDTGGYPKFRGGNGGCNGYHAVLATAPPSKTVVFMGLGHKYGGFIQQSQDMNDLYIYIYYVGGLGLGSGRYRSVFCA